MKQIVSHRTEAAQVTDSSCYYAGTEHTLFVLAGEMPGQEMPCFTVLLVTPLIRANDLLHSQS